MLDILLITVFPACMALAAAMDLVTMTIPNRLVLAVAAGFFVLAPGVGLGLDAMGLHAALAIGMLVITFGFFAMGWIGGGDAKLFAATALWMGPGLMLEYALTATLFGGALTLGLLMWRDMLLPAGLLQQGWIVRLHAPREGIPYGIALAAAGLVVYAKTPFMAALGG